MRIGIDTGGTFTDVVALTARGARIHKLASTPDDPARAVLAGLAVARHDSTTAVDLVHGTTVGLNAILTGRIARTALVTNAGFEDLCEIGRQDRRDIYELDAQRAELPVPRALRFGLPARRGADGAELARPTRDDLRRLRDRLARARVDAIAIGLLHSYAHPDDERRIAKALAPLGVPITCSAELLPVHGEFERFAAAVLNAAIRPTVGEYVERLAAGVRPGRVRLLRSSGGILSADEAARYPARAVFSGPAGGVQAALALARTAGAAQVAAFDMGGTSTDVAFVSEQVRAVRDVPRVAGLPLAVPALDVHTVGCGGGSIARVDAGGALRVGPESAGAVPGPACYGSFDEPTVTDAHMALGHLGGDSLLAGAFPVDPDRSVRAIERLARRLGVPPLACARGIVEIADVAMSRALLVITVERAVDPASVPLIAYGGAGGLHAASLAARLGMPRAIVPEAPGAFSALGLALAGESQEASEPLLVPLTRIATSELRARCAALARLAADRLEDRGRPRVACTARLRFVGQGSGLWIPVDRGHRDLASRFSATHHEQFGFVPDAPIEVVELRAVAQLPGIDLPKIASAPSPPRAARVRRAPLGTGRLRVIDRRDLAPGTSVVGPAIIEEMTAATRLPAGFRATVGAAWLELLPSTRRQRNVASRDRNLASPD